MTGLMVMLAALKHEHDYEQESDLKLLGQSAGSNGIVLNDF